MLRISIAASLLFVSACSGADTGAAEQEVARFHQRLAAGEVDSIWASAGPDMKKAGTKAEFDAFLNAVRRKLGKVRSTERTGWRVNYGTSGGTVELAYSTQFEHGAGTEQFVFSTGEPPALVGYHVNSPALITR